MKTFPVANPGLELNAEQTRESEDGRALALRVGVDRVWPHIRVVFDEVVQDVVALPGAAGREAGEESDVHVRDHVVADAAVPAVSQMVLGHKVLGLEIPLGSVGGSMFAKAPDPRQGKLVVTVDDGRDRLVQLAFGDVPLVHEGHLPPIQTTDRTRCLGRTEVKSVTKSGHKIPLGRICQFTIVP
ncbi:MAG: hypothetical protein JWQ42_4817 [Edaphobacter sp.]|nr:hypothetical protein [Edaphobacter sp.]